MAFEQVKMRTAQGQEYGPVPMSVLIRWHQEGRVPMDAFLVDAESGEAQPVVSFPGLGFVGPTAAAPAGPPTAMDRLIPARNPKALFAYYLGVFGLVPLFSPFLGPVALILGILGVRAAKELKVGSGHGWAGIILGGIESGAAIWGIIWLVQNAH
jgi:hypothetical protein